MLYNIAENNIEDIDSDKEELYNIIQHKVKKCNIKKKEIIKEDITTENKEDITENITEDIIENIPEDIIEDNTEDIIEDNTEDDINKQNGGKQHGGKFMNFLNEHFDINVNGINFWEMLLFGICIIFIIAVIIFNGDWVKMGFNSKVYVYILLGFWFLAHIGNILLNLLNDKSITEKKKLFKLETYQLIILIITVILFTFSLLQKFNIDMKILCINPVNFAFGIAIIEILRIIIGFGIYNIPEIKIANYNIFGKSSLVIEDIRYMIFSVLFIIIYLIGYFATDKISFIEDLNEDYFIYCIIGIFLNLYKNIYKIGTPIIYLILLLLTIIYKIKK